MNKSKVILSFALCLIVFASFAIAADNTTTNTSSTTTSANTTVTTTINGTKIDRAFSCLETQVKSDCSGVNKIQDIALTILASPSGVTQKCYEKLIGLSKTNCFGDSNCNVKDTAMAILALNHVGQETKVYQNWLINNTRTAEDLVWYLEQDSVGKTSCKITYDSVDYNFNVLENKKIETAAGNCLSLANSNYWFQIAPNCYNKKFTIVCDAANGYIATLLYKQPTSSTLYVLSETKSAQASQPIELAVKSLCFGNTNACDYESSAWAAIALEKTSNNIQDYIPYLIAGEEANQKYLPAAFLQILKDYSEYGTKLIQQQKLNSWEAENTAYNKYYDSGLALLALSSSNQQKVADAKSWLLNIAQDASGCWNNNNIRDTAMILWAIEGRRTSVTGPTKPLPACTEAKFFCIASEKCPSGELEQNYYCSGVGKACCQNENLESCDVMGGLTCADGKVCSGDERRASDTQKCCLGECQTPVEKSECETAGNYCKTSCSSNQQETVESCSGELVCCKTAVTPATKSYTWLWILLIILILLVIAGIIFREKLKVWIYKIRSGFKEDKGGVSKPGTFPPVGPYPGEKPLQQRPPVRPLPMAPQSRPMPMPANRPPMRR